MASEPGGRADKLGNEFERLWAVRHLIELIAGTATTFRMEALGDDEKGTEFWVGRPDGVREAHQCKRENGAIGKWSVADLESKRIMSNAKFHLDRHPLHRFVFASGDKATHMSDLSERTERCDSPAEFVSYLTTTSSGLKNEFGNICRILGLDPKLSEGAANAVDFLRRFRAEVVDKNRLRSTVEELAARWVSGEPADVVAALKDLLDVSLGKTLREPDVVTGLPDGARPRDLARDPTLRSALDELRDRFDRSYRHLLIGGRSLGRREAADLVAVLTAEDGPRLVLVHGSGGDGKSGVAFEAVEQLRLRGIPCLPLRLDRNRPEDSPLKFGRSLGLPGSPANCLAAAAGGGLGVLVLDQVDAIRWTAAHSSHAWDTCERTVSEVLGLLNLRVVVVCRSFDLEDDPRIKAWEKGSKARKLKVEPLDDATVDTVISSRGVSPASLEPKQRKVLRSPQGLYLWLALHEGDNRPPAFRTMTDLMRRFWETTRRRLTGLKPGRYEAALEALVSHLDRRGALSGPRTVVEPWPEEVAALLSLNVLVAGPGERLLFSHQSYLDYLTAVRILRQVHAGSGTVLGWLAEDDQSLFRRGQLRQLLTLLRDDDPGQFLDSMKDLLHGSGVRFHLQHLAVQMLGHSETPTDEEVELVLGLLDRPEWVNHLYFQVLAGREAWFDALHRRGILRRWLEGPDEKRVNLAIQIVECVVASRGADVELLFLERGRERWPGRLVLAVWRTPPEKLTEGLFDAALDVRRCGEWNAHDFVNWKSFAQASPARCIRMLEAKIGRNLDELAATPVEGEVNRRDRDDTSMLVELSSLAGSAGAIPVDSWDRLVPLYLRASRLSGRLRRRSRRKGGDPHVYNLGRSARWIRGVLRDVLTAAGRAMARDTPQSFWDRAGSESHGARPVQRLIDRCTSHGPDDRADVAVRRLRDHSRFRSGQGDRGAVYRTAWKALRRYSGGCSDELFSKLQAAVLAHWPVEERDAYRFYHERNRRENFWGPVEFDVLKCNDLGLGQYLLLAGMPRTRLSPEARDRMGVFRRKFGTVKPLLKGRPRGAGGWVGSTIPDDRLPKVSDRNWLGIIRRDWSSRSRHPKQMGPDRLGEVSVESFALALGRMAALQPARFARLALRMPVDRDPRYLVAILRSLAERKPPTETPNGPSGEQATVAQIEAVIRRFAFMEGDREFCMSVCRAIEQWHDPAWDDDTILLLSRLATSHPDPQPGRYAVSGPRDPDRDGENGDRPNAAMSSINCVRGVAAGAITAVLFDHPERLGMLQPAVDSLVNDPHAAVRAAAVGLALPLYNIDRGVAVGTFLKACSHQDDAVLRSYHLNHFLRYTILDFVDRLRPVIERMVGFEIGEVAKTGAAWAALAWAHRGLMDDIASVCAEGTRWQRLGVADAASNAAARGHDRPAVLDLIRSLFNDPEREVRGVASRVFRVAECFDQPSAVSLAEAFLWSRALDDNVHDLLYGIEGLTGPLKPYAPVICGLADRFAGPLAAESRDIRTHRPLEAGLLAKVMLRLYEQSEHDRALRRRCLDAWDGLLRQGIGHDVLQSVDA